MGQDLRAIIPHRLKPDRIIDLPELLNSHNKRFLTLLPEVRLDVKNIGVKHWHDGWVWFGDQPNKTSDILEIWKKSDVIGLEGPGSLFLSFGRQCAIIGSWIRWREFLTDRRIFNGWRAIVQYFTGFLKASSAIYVPDSGPVNAAVAEDYVFKGNSFETIQRFLLEQCGQPLTTIDAVEEIEKDVYFYDDFGIKEYDEDSVLTKYMWNNYIKFTTEWERKVNLAIILNWKAEAYEDPTVGWKYNKQLGEDFKNDINAHNEIKDPDAFREKVRNRILKEHKEDIFINRCSKCNKIVRTPKAKQCFWCGYDWH